MATKRKKFYIILLVTIVILVAIRIALPYIAKSYINKQLNNIEGYHASIADVSMSLYRGAFGIGDLLIYEEASSSPDTPFIKLPNLDFSLDWRALFKGKIVSIIFMDGLEVNFSKLKEEISEDENPRITFAEELQEMNPISINRLEITNAKIAYRDPTSSPQVNVFFDDFTLLANNLTNVENPDVTLPANIEINSKAMGEGSLEILVDLNFLKHPPDFDLNISFEDIDLVRFNEFMEAYANLNLESGFLNVYAEMAAESGEVKGYIKPIIEDLSIDTDQEDRNLLEKIYDETANVAADVLENKKKEKVATRIEIDGTLNDVETDVWQTILNLLKNAFFEAYSKEIENVINFESAKRE